MLGQLGPQGQTFLKGIVIVFVISYIYKKYLLNGSGSQLRQVIVCNLSYIVHYEPQMVYEFRWENLFQHYTNGSSQMPQPGNCIAGSTLPGCRERFLADEWVFIVKRLTANKVKLQYALDESESNLISFPMSIHNTDW